MIYPGDREQYFSFLTLEAYTSMEEWMKYRSKCDEEITKDSYIMRNIWHEDFMGRDGDEVDGTVRTGPFRYNPPNGWTCISINEHGEIQLDKNGNPKYFSP